MKYHKAFIALLAITFVILGVTSMLRKSPTCDEAAHHIASGYVHLKKADFAFSPESPPLARHIMSAPLVFLNLQMPDDRNFWAREDRSKFSREFLYGINRSQASRIFLMARLPILMVGLFGGCFLFFWIRKHYDSLSAVVATFLYFLSPNILAHSRFATTDIVATVFIMCSIFSFWDYLIKPGKKQIFIAGAFLGLALMSKFTALALVPVYCLIILSLVVRKYISGEKRESYVLLSSFFGVVFISIIVLWSGYFFEYKPFLEGALRAEWKEAFFINLITKVYPDVGMRFLDNCRRMLYETPVLLSSYLMGILGIIRHGIEGSTMFFVGKWGIKGHPLYFLVAFFIKTPIPVIFSFLFGLFVILKKKHKTYINLYLLCFVLLFFVLASRSNLQLGLRYVLPAYPLIFLIGAVGVRELLLGKYFYKGLAVISLIWMMVIHVFIWPDYLSYFNEFIGGPSNGYKYLRDSNIDWGQDLPALKEYMESKAIDEIFLSYFGTADPAFYDINYTEIFPEDTDALGGKVCAVSVQYLENFEWTKVVKPTHVIGYSIFIYDFRNQDRIMNVPAEDKL